ncbi:MAG: transporter substrate-binding domain-containing protein [Lachnospiraceae bacterium]|nr:transporter substrate-binding domain-containing protein [Lachnospiraceae bacterium]
MKNIKKLLCVLLVVVMTMGLVACGSKEEPAEAPVEEEKEEEVAEEKYPEGYTLRVAMNCGVAPFNWTQDDDSNGAWPIDGTDQYVAGYDVQIARLICETYGWNLQVIKTDWDGMIPGVVSGKVDCCISTLGVTEERKQSVDFSDYYWNNGIVMVVRKDSPYVNATGIEDFAGAKVTTQLVSIWMPLVEQIPDVIAEPGLADMSELFVAVNSGKIDAMITGLTEAQSGCMSNPDLTYVTLEEGKGFDVELSALCAGIPLEKGNTELKEKFDAVIATLSHEKQLEMMTNALHQQPLSDGSDADALVAEETKDM